MKRFHEVAVVKDRFEKIRGFLLGAEEDANDIVKFDYNIFRYIDVATFNEYVRGGQVQYFEQDSNNAIIVNYTDEELELFKKLGNKALLGVANKSMSFDDYIRNDVVFSYEHMLIHEKHGVTVGTLISVNREPFIGDVYSIMLFGKDCCISRMENHISRCTKSIQKWINFIRKNRNNGVLMVPANMYKDIAGSLGVLTHVNTPECHEVSGAVDVYQLKRKRFMEVKPEIERINEFIASILH